MSDDKAPALPGRGITIRGPQDFFAGFLMVLLSAVVLWALTHVTTASYQSISPTLFPRICGNLLAAGGLALIVRGLLVKGPSMQPLPLRGVFFVTSSIVLFGALAPAVGYLIAGFLTVIVGGLGVPRGRLCDLLLLAAGLTLACYVIFTVGLRLTLPVLPFID
jgi:hypothetical protein